MISYKYKINTYLRICPFCFFFEVLLNASAYGLPSWVKTVSKSSLGLTEDDSQLPFFQNSVKKKNFAFFWTLTDFCISKCAPRLGKTLYSRTKWFIQDRLQPPIVCMQTTDHPTNTVTITITDHYHHYRLLQLPLQTITNTGCKLQITSGICSVV